MNKNKSPIGLLAVILVLFVLVIAVGRLADGNKRISVNEQVRQQAAATTLPVTSEGTETADGSSQPAADTTADGKIRLPETDETTEPSPTEKMTGTTEMPDAPSAAYNRRNARTAKPAALFRLDDETQKQPEELPGPDEMAEASARTEETLPEESEASDQETPPVTDTPTTAAPTTTLAPTTTAAPVIRTGFFYENGILHYHNGSGRPVTGWGTYEGRTYYFQNGTPAYGLIWIDGGLYYISGGIPQTGWRSFSDGKIYFTDSGRAAAGFTDIGGERYYFNGNGRMQTSYQTIDGKRYYFYSDGKMARNTTVDIVWQADENGVLTNRFSEITDANLDDYIDYLLLKNGNTPVKIYEYVKKNYLIRDTPKQSVREMAIHILNKGSGACYNFASLAIVMLQRAGYRARLVTGESRHAAEHDWVLYEPQPGVWRHMDPYRNWLRIYYLTDDQLEEYDDYKGCSYIWDRNQWTSTTSTGYGAMAQAETTAAPTQPPETQSSAATTAATVPSATQPPTQTTTTAPPLPTATQPPATTQAPTTTAAPPATTPEPTTTAAPPTAPEVTTPEATVPEATTAAEETTEPLTTPEATTAEPPTTEITTEAATEETTEETTTEPPTTEETTEATTEATTEETTEATTEATAEETTEETTTEKPSVTETGPTTTETVPETVQDPSETVPDPAETQPGT